MRSALTLEPAMRAFEARREACLDCPRIIAREEVHTDMADIVSSCRVPSTVRWEQLWYKCRVLCQLHRDIPRVATATWLRRWRRNESISERYDAIWRRFLESNGLESNLPPQLIRKILKTFGSLGMSVQSNVARFDAHRITSFGKELGFHSQPTALALCHVGVSPMN